jgi:hypothetical protein
MSIKQLSDGGSEGTLLGQNASDLVGFYGLSTPIAQPATITTVDTTTITAVQVATATTTHLIAAANSLITDSQAQAATINTLIARLQALGLIASS